MNDEALYLAVHMAQGFEGFARRVRVNGGVAAVPYLCPASYWTIAWGHLCAADHPPVSETEGRILLLTDLRIAYAGAMRCCPGLVTESPRRQAAVTDFVLNLGAGRLAASTLRKRINARDWRGAATENLRWVYGGGRVLPGLVLRRQYGFQLLLQG